MLAKMVSWWWYYCGEMLSGRRIYSALEISFSIRRRSQYDDSFIRLIWHRSPIGSFLSCRLPNNRRRVQSRFCHCYASKYNATGLKSDTWVVPVTYAALDTRMGEVVVARPFHS